MGRAGEGNAPFNTLSVRLAVAVDLAFIDVVLRFESHDAVVEKFVC